MLFESYVLLCFIQQILGSDFFLSFFLCWVADTQLNHVTVMSTRFRWGWVFVERTRILSGIQFTRHFIEFFAVETKQFVGSNVNVILPRQTCGQRSSMSAGSKRRALASYFCVRICHMFLISKRSLRTVGSRTVHNVGTCKQNATEHWQIPTIFAAKYVSTSEVANPQRHSVCKYWSCVQT